MYALEQIDLSAYPAYNILSIGCGGAPDLMAFDAIRTAWDTTELFYKGYDVSPYWAPIHNAIKQYMNSKEHISSKFENKNIFTTLNEGKPAVHHYNVVVLEYFLSHFLQQSVKQIGEELFDGLIANVLANRLDDSPFLFLINDIDHYEVRNCFDTLLQKLKDAGYSGSYIRKHFDDRRSDYSDGSAQYSTNINRFSIPDKMKKTFHCAISCSSAQLIAEVAKK